MARWVNLDDCVEISVGEMNFYPVELLGDVYEEVAPVIHAHWIKRDNPNYSPFDGSFPLDLICSHCGLEHVVVSHFCPDCGAKMDEEVE